MNLLATYWLRQTYSARDDCCWYHWKFFVLIGSQRWTCSHCFKRWQLVLDADGHWGWEEIE